MARWAVVLLVAHLAFAVDKSNFKTCDQSSFCRRLRGLAPGATSLTLPLDTVVVDGATLKAEVRDERAELTLELVALADGTFRLFMDEKQPLHPRYRVPYALDGEPSKDRLTLAETDPAKGFVKVLNSQGHAVVLHSKPFKVEFFNKRGASVMVVNEKGLTTVEPLKAKPQPQSVDGENRDNGDEQIVNAVEKPEEMDPGAWEENYKSHYDTKPRGPEALSVDLTFPQASHLYGIPEHADDFALKSTKNQEPYRLYNLDVFEYELQSKMALYASIPVIYAHGSEGDTVGAFWLNSAETWVDVEAASSDRGNVVSSLVNLVSGSAASPSSARFMSESGVFDLFVLMGPSPADCFRQYTRLTGTAKLPQLFSLAYHQSRWNYNDEEDVRTVQENFDLHDIPLDVIWLDIEYTDQKKYFTWDSIKFPTPTDMISNLTAKGRKMIVIIDPHIKRTGGYIVHDEATDRGYYVKNKDNKDYEGWCWPGSSSYLDFFNPVVRDYYSSKYLPENFPGTTKDFYIWNDMNEPSVFNGPEITMPKDNIHFGDWEHRHVHNLYGLLQTMGTYDGLLKRSQNSLRPFVLTRAAFPGSQRYAAIWTGDNTAEWSHLVATIPMCLSLSVAGMSFCGADVGGFFKYPEAELMTRWYQLAAFQPFFRAHSHIDTKRREPYLYDTQTTNLIRDAIRRRYSYLPFWYTMFYEHTIKGVPVMQPLFMHFPKETDVFSIDNEYILGGALLVRPVTEEGATSVSVHLPGSSTGDVWYDVDTYSQLQPGKVNQHVSLAKIPVYQRGGTIVPKKDRVRRSSPLMINDPYTLIVALSPNVTARGTLYMDDEQSFDYKQKKYVYADIEFKDNRLTYKLIDNDANYPTKSWLEKVVIVGLKAPPKRAELAVSPSSSAVKLNLIYHTGNDVLVVRKPGVSMASSWEISFA